MTHGDEGVGRTFVPVSVIIPCHNCADTIGRAIDSVVLQVCRPTELILVDDGSSDGTLEKLRAYQSRLGTDWVKVIALGTNGGPSIARNRGWDAATQPYIAFLDADDAWHPMKLLVQCQWMLSHPSVALTGHGHLWVVSTAPEVDLPREWCARQVAPRRLLVSNRLATSTVMLRRDVPNRFDAAKRYSEDYLLWLDIALSGHTVFYIDLPLAYSFKAPYGEGGLSGHLWKMEVGELDTLRRLASTGLITRASLWLLYPWSMLKFLRRALKMIRLPRWRRPRRDTTMLLDDDASRE